VADSGGVYLVPAFGGLGSPWWDPDAQCILTGLTLGTEPGHIARAALESIAFQVEDVLGAMTQGGAPLPDLLADGGASGNPDLMQAQADLSGRRVHASAAPHLSPLGAAQFGGITCGLWTREEPALGSHDRAVYIPRLDGPARRALRAEWSAAVSRARIRPAA
jgi:glycerol kinase